ncbi:MAG: hypothetical protein R8G66_18085 [Cytophagales bacterium]|nr:hypothetical protein [Cytophagales bacterium]
MEAIGQSTDTLKYKFDIKIGGQRKSGVVSQITLRVTSNNELENKKLILTNLSSYTYNEVNGVNIADDWEFRTYAMLKLNSTTRLLPVFAHNYFKNVLYRITSSHRALAGVSIIPFKRYKDHSFIVGAGHEFSNYNGEVFAESSVVSSQRNFPLVFLKISGKHKLGKHKILIGYNFLSVQSFKEAKDYSFWLTSGVSVPLNKKISIGVNYDFRFRNVHLSDIPTMNDLLLFNITFDHSN